MPQIDAPYRYQPPPAPPPPKSPPPPKPPQLPPELLLPPQSLDEELLPELAIADPMIHGNAEAPPPKPPPPHRSRSPPDLPPPPPLRLPQIIKRINPIAMRQQKVEYKPCEVDTP